MYETRYYLKLKLKLHDRIKTIMTIIKTVIKMMIMMIIFRAGSPVCECNQDHLKLKINYMIE